MPVGNRFYSAATNLFHSRNTPEPSRDRPLLYPLEQDVPATGPIQLSSHVPTAFGCTKPTDRKTAADSAVTAVAVAQTSLRVTLTAWRCGAKMVLRITERDAAESVGVGKNSSAGGPGAGPEKQAEGKASAHKERAQLPLGEGGAIVVIHEEEVRCAKVPDSSASPVSCPSCPTSYCSSVVASPQSSSSLVGTVRCADRTVRWRYFPL